MTVEEFRLARSDRRKAAEYQYARRIFGRRAEHGWDRMNSHIFIFPFGFMNFKRYLVLYLIFPIIAIEIKKRSRSIANYFIAKY